MIEYVYRVDTQTGLEKIQDNHFRARRSGTSDSFHHELLKRLHSTLPRTDGLFRVCFYVSQVRAEQSSSYDPSHFGKSYVLRCPKESVLSCGFTESWDDGFKEGDAYLFWIQETLSHRNARFSSAGVDFDLFEICKQGQWHPLKNHYA